MHLSSHEREKVVVVANLLPCAEREKKSHKQYKVIVCKQKPYVVYHNYDKKPNIR